MPYQWCATGDLFHRCTLVSQHSITAASFPMIVTSISTLPYFSAVLNQTRTLHLAMKISTLSVSTLHVSSKLGSSLVPGIVWCVQVTCRIHANTPLAIYLMPISCGEFAAGNGHLPLIMYSGGCWGMEIASTNCLLTTLLSSAVMPGAICTSAHASSLSSLSHLLSLL